MTTMNTSSLLLVLVAVTTAAFVCAFAPSPAPTGSDPDPYHCPWRTVAFPELPFIQKLGKWAVDHQENAHMRFDKVESAKWQGVGGNCTALFYHNYYYELIIDALAAIRAGPGDDKYRAVVYVTNFTEPQELESFDRWHHTTGGQLMSMHALPLLSVLNE